MSKLMSVARFARRHSDFAAAVVAVVVVYLESQGLFHLPPEVYAALFSGVATLRGTAKKVEERRALRGASE